MKFALRRLVNGQSIGRRFQQLNVKFLIYDFFTKTNDKQQNKW